MNDAVIESVASNQALLMVACGVFGTIFVIDRVWAIVQKQKNGASRSAEQSPVIPTEILRELAQGMASMARTIEHVERDLSAVRESLTTVKETVALIDSRQRDRDR